MTRLLALENTITGRVSAKWRVVRAASGFERRDCGDNALQHAHRFVTRCDAEQIAERKHPRAGLNRGGLA
jgi:hypothetical protein